MYRSTALIALLCVTLPRPSPAESPVLPWVRGKLAPAWGDALPGRRISHEYDAEKSKTENGAALAKAILALRPGDRLEIAPGTYSIASKLVISLRGSETAPIWIVGADEKHPPVITRPDARQNVMNVGERGRAQYLIFRNLELTGGSTLIRFYDCGSIWLDRCHLHHAGAEGITTNSRDTSDFFITNNHFHHFVNPKATGEAMYLGANHGKAIMSYSVIARNHVHDCRGTQGDGIELKQGSHSNWIVENRVHDTRYPAIIAYGTGGRGVNMIERNTCYRSGDNLIQVQGEAIVRNNLLVDAAGAGLASTDHQGKTRRLTVVHNTIVSRRRGANLSSWNDREDMVFANNLIYSEGDAIRFPAGSRRVVFEGNVVLGAVTGIDSGFSRGKGLTEFEGIDWSARKLLARPLSGAAAVGAATERFLVTSDLEGRPRDGRRVSGAYDAP